MDVWGSDRSRGSITLKKGRSEKEKCINLCCSWLDKGLGCMVLVFAYLIDDLNT